MATTEKLRQPRVLVSATGAEAPRGLRGAVGTAFVQGQSSGRRRQPVQHGPVTVGSPAVGATRAGQNGGGGQFFGTGLRARKKRAGGTCHPSGCMTVVGLAGTGLRVRRATRRVCVERSQPAPTEVGRKRSVNSLCTRGIGSIADSGRGMKSAPERKCAQGNFILPAYAGLCGMNGFSSTPMEEIT